MALTLEQWHSKILKLLPKPYYSRAILADAHLWGLAALMRQVQLDAEGHVGETYLTTGHNSYLDAQGEERGIRRIEGEIDSQYVPRLQNLRNQSSIPKIKAIVDALLIEGECTIIEDEDAGVFCNRESFCNRGAIFLDPPIWNTFSILVDKQLHDPYSFSDREHFCGREDFVGAALSLDFIFSLIIEAVNNAKAEGTLYRIIERTGE